MKKFLSCKDLGCNKKWGRLKKEYMEWILNETANELGMNYDYCEETEIIEKGEENRVSEGS